MSRTRLAKGRRSSSPAPVAVGRQGDRPRPTSASATEGAVSAIQGMNLKQLRVEWTRHFGSPAPGCRSKEVIRGLLAWRIQAENYGGMMPDTVRRLRRLTEALERSADPGNAGNGKRFRTRTAVALKPGTVLTREWRGILHKVHVLKDAFGYGGHNYRSLSEIARIITGTRWSGPRFFGVTEEDGAVTAPLRRASS